MSRHCNRCNVDVVDEAIECPLCHGVLELDDEDKVENIYYFLECLAEKCLFIVSYYQFLTMLINYFMNVVF